MTAAEVRKLTDEEIAVETDRLQRRLYDLRAQTVTDKVEDTSQFRKIRADIARLKTERHARTLAAMKQEAGA
jgi:ribosomal protein L29